jgi:hypothetical protein
MQFQSNPSLGKIPNASDQIPRKFQMDVGGADRIGFGILEYFLAFGYWRL